MRKRTLSLILVLVLCMGVLPLGALAGWEEDATPTETDAAIEEETPAEPEAPEEDPTGLDETEPAEEEGPETIDAVTGARGSGFPAPETPPTASSTMLPADLVSWTEADGFADGQDYAIVLRENGCLYAVTNIGGSIVAVEIESTEDITDDMIWAAAAGNNGVSLENGGVYLLYGDETLGTRDSAAKRWSFSGGSLSYSRADTQYYAGGLSGDGFTCGTSSGSAGIYIIYTNGESTGSGSSSGSSSPSGSGSGSNSPSGSAGSSLTYTRTDTLSEGYVSFAANGYSFGISRGSVTIVTAEVTGGEPAVTSSNYLTAAAVEGGYTLSKDSAGSTVYLTAENGTVDKADTSAGYWNYYDNGRLVYTAADGTNYYVSGITSAGITVSASEGDSIPVDLYAGSSAHSMGDGSPGSPGSDLGSSSGGGSDSGGGPGNSTETDEDAPVIVTQPLNTHYVYADEEYDAPVYTIEAQLPADSSAGSLRFVWYIDGEAVQETESTAAPGETVADKFTANALQGREVGVYNICCEVSCTAADGEAGEPATHTVESDYVVFIICSGVISDSVLTFSDVHEDFTNISAAISDIMAANDGMIPALIICTGDWANSTYSGTKEDNINTVLLSYIARLTAQAGGIDTVFVSGDHDNSIAASTATAAANLADTTDFETYGAGVIYDSSYDGDAGSSSADQGLIVYGINYEALKVNRTYTYENVLPLLESYLEELSQNYNGELLIISAHAGLHVVDDWDGDNDYNIDMSYDMVELLNRYGDTIDILFLFGHDHSRGEREFFLTRGDTITSTISFADRTSGEQTLSFSYGHAGYITGDTGGRTRYSFITWDDGAVARVMRAASSGSTVDSLSVEIDRVADPADEKEPEDTEDIP